MICAQAIIHFRPKAAYEKYLRMLVSAMLLIQVFLAVGSIFTRDFQEKISESAGKFMEGFDTVLFEEAWQMPETFPEQQEQSERSGIQIAPIAPVRVGEITIGR